MVVLHYHESWSSYRIIKFISFIDGLKNLRVGIFLLKFVIDGI